MAYTWQIPDRLTPGTNVNVSGTAKVVFDNVPASKCGHNMAPVGDWYPEEGRLTVSYDLVSGSGQLIGLQFNLPRQATIGCSVPTDSLSGSFTVPEKVGTGGTPRVTFNAWSGRWNPPITYIFK
jgi:hypothetical protein